MHERISRWDRVRILWDIGRKVIRRDPAGGRGINPGLWRDGKAGLGCGWHQPDAAVGGLGSFLRLSSL